MTIVCIQGCMSIVCIQSYMSVVLHTGLHEHCLHTGLHEGLKTLSDGGTPPKLLIIDDGWQCTDVDVPLRKPMTSRMLMIEEMRESMEGTQDEFIDAELEWLARGAKDLPPSSSAGGPHSC